MHNSRWFLLAGMLWAIAWMATHLSAADKNATELETQLSELTKEMRLSKDATEFRDHAQKLRKLAQVAVKAYELPVAVKAINTAAESAKKANNPYLVSLVQHQKDETLEAQKAFAKLKVDWKRLTETPDDPKANQKLGEFDCVYGNAWDVGAAKLVQSDDKLWKRAAELELDKPTDASANTDRAQAWIAVSQQEKDAVKTKTALRAAHWANLALPMATDDAVRQKLEDIKYGAPEQWLVDMREMSVQGGPWPLGKGQAGNGSEIQVGGVVSPRSIGLHAVDGGTASFSYQTRERFKRFTAGVGINDHNGDEPRPVKFQVVGDGKILWESKPITRRKQLEFCNVNIKGVRVLELRIVAPGVAVNSHTCWFDPQVSMNGK